MAKQPEPETTAADPNDSTHVMIDGTRFDYVKKLNRGSGVIPPIGNEPAPYMRLTGYIDEGQIEIGDDRDVVRWTGLITCQTRDAGRVPIDLVSRGLVFPELDGLFSEHFKTLHRRVRGGGQGDAYYGLDPFLALTFGLDVMVQKPSKPNRRGYDFGIKLWNKPAVVFAGHHVFKSAADDLFKPFDKAA